MATTTPQNSIFTQPPLKKMSLFKLDPNVCIQILKDEKNHQQTVFTRANYL